MRGKCRARDERKGETDERSRKEFIFTCLQVFRHNCKNEDFTTRSLRFVMCEKYNMRQGISKYRGYVPADAKFYSKIIRIQTHTHKKRDIALASFAICSISVIHQSKVPSPSDSHRGRCIMSRRPKRLGAALTGSGWERERLLTLADISILIYILIFTYMAYIYFQGNM